MKLALPSDPLAPLLAAGFAVLQGRAVVGAPPKNVEAALLEAERQRLGALALHGARALGAAVDAARVTAAEEAAHASQRWFLLGMHEVADRLSHAGVRHAFFKGAVHDRLLFGGKGLRGSSDIDVLVDDLRAARAALVPLATEMEVERRRPLLGKRALTSSLPVHLLGRHIIVDMHARFVMPPLVDDSAAVLGRAISDPLPRPTFDDMAAFIPANLISDRFSGRHKLTLDFAALLAAQPLAAPVDWAIVTARAAQWGCAGALWVVAQYVHTTFGVPLPLPLAERPYLPPMRRALLEASVRGAPLPGAITRAFESDALGAGLRGFARDVPNRLLDRLRQHR